MPNCSSCGSYIPEGQGSSCSMCYGDPFWGRDGYYLEYLEQQNRIEQAKKEMEEEAQRQFEQIPPEEGE